MFEPAAENPSGEVAGDPSGDSASVALEQLSGEVAALRDLFQRRLLEDRSKQRLYDELYRQLKFAQGGLVDQYLAPMVREVLLVVDRVEASAEQVPPESPESLEVLDSIRAELLEVLLRRGLSQVDAQGERFDPRLHEAVGRAAVPDEEQVGRVVEVRRPGYLLEDRLVRPAQVVVGYPGDEGEGVGRGPTATYGRPT